MGRWKESGEEEGDITLCEDSEEGEKRGMREPIRAGIGEASELNDNWVDRVCIEEGARI